jgi:protein-L-isoaspartate(D-aspartate) O-methyltransferase
MSSSANADSFSIARGRMVAEQLRARGISDPGVLEAFSRVPRHEFVSAEHRHDAYGDYPLPITGGQTISQPYIVAAMLSALRLTSNDIVLEIGTGSGFQTALLAELVSHVYSVERLESLAERARSLLWRLGYRNVTVFTGDGSGGLPELGPFDAVIVSAAAPRITPAWLEQLREGGRMIVPVGSPQAQELQLVHKLGGQAVTQRLEGCRFVPLVGTEGFPSAG